MNPEDQKKPNPNLPRYVAILTPLIGAPAAGMIATVVANNAPAGAELPNKGTAGAISSAAVFIIGAVAALVKSHDWIKGWQAYERDERLLQSSAPVLPPGTGAGGDGVGEEDDWDDSDLSWDDSAELPVTPPAPVGAAAGPPASHWIEVTNPDAVQQPQYEGQQVVPGQGVVPAPPQQTQSLAPGGGA
jgi:hypothetical protein